MRKNKIKPKPKFKTGDKVYFVAKSLPHDIDRIGTVVRMNESRTTTYIIEWPNGSRATYKPNELRLHYYYADFMDKIKDRMI